MKTILFLFCLWAYASWGQNLTGVWQVTHESQCMDQELGTPSETEEELEEAMQSMSGRTPKVMILKADLTGEWNWKSVGKKKSAHKEKFIYRISDGIIYILDKRSRLITDTFFIELNTADSLVVFRKDRSCERYEMVRTK
jgi:hypothetical protein